MRAAISELEAKLGVPMGIEVCKARPADDGLIQGVHFDRLVSRLPYNRAATNTWFRIDLPSASVISVDRIRAYYFDVLVWEFSEANGNMNFVKLEWGEQGTLHIIPTDLLSVVITNNADGGGSNYGVWHTINIHQSPVPDFWAVDFTRGPISKQGGATGEIEAVLAHWCYCVAGITLLSIGGLAQSQGLTSASISMDGVSRSVGLQASAIYGLNSALEHVLDEATKRINWKSLRSYKRGLPVMMYGY